MKSTATLPIEQEILDQYDKEYRIVVSDKGFVHIGRAKKIECPFLGDVVRLHDSYTIRHWGTESGLGQLCQEGKQEGTILDYNGVVDIALSSILHTYLIRKTALETYDFIR